MPLMGRTARERRWERTQARLEANADLIPEGMYCYTHVADPELDARRRAEGRTGFIPGRFVMCPFWEMRRDKPEQEQGFCRMLRAGDWMRSPRGTMLLWDQCKECGFKNDLTEADWLPDDVEEPATTVA